MIEVQNLTRRYGRFTAVDDISFTARPGEILGFLGPNGAGKTTTMRVLTGYMPPTSGSVSIAGHDVFTDSFAARQQIGYLPERVPLYPDMTVRGTVDFVAELRRVPDRRARVMAVLEQVGMQDRADSLIRNISKGMRQRVGLAQALVHDPPVLILDEPTIGLDPRQVLEVRDLVRGLSASDRTVLFSTHILSEAAQVCDRVLIIDRGRLVAEGPPNTLREQLQIGGRLYVRLGDAPPNQVRKTLKTITGVTGVTAEEDGGYTVQMMAGTDARGEVARLAVHAGWDVLELRPTAMTLEDIFLEYTAKNFKAPGGKR
jgi:ABC-2 type transport system ATP-binding protein